jgi:anti-sigma factor RsiW
MSCKEVRKYLDAYVDGELEAGLMLDVDGHLGECESCSASTLVKRRLKEALWERGQVQAPEHLRLKVQGLADRRRFNRNIAAALAVPVAAAAALAAIFVLPKNSDVNEEPFAEVMEDVVERHVRELPMEVKGPDPAQAASWFRQKVDFPVQAPALNLSQASFEGARLSNVRSHQAAHMAYNLDGHRVTLMIFNPHITLFRGGRQVKVGDRDVLVGRRNGFNVAVFLDGDMAYALSSDLPQERLLKLVAEFKK